MATVEIPEPAAARVRLLRGLALAGCVLSIVSASAVSAHGKGKKATSGAAREAQVKDTHDKAADAFENFCTEWMRKLAARERDNVTKIKWEPTTGGLQGTYVGYSTEHQCTLAEGSDIPVGKIAYHEVTYRRRGTTIPEAERNPPETIEVYEVTELFEYTKGKWDY